MQSRLCRIRETCDVFRLCCLYIHLPSMWKGLDHCWSCISLSNTTPKASVQPDTSDIHFEAALFEQLHLAQMKGNVCHKDCVSFSCLLQNFSTGREELLITILCLLSGHMSF